MKKIIFVILLTAIQFCFGSPTTTTSTEIKVWTIEGMFMTFNGVEVLVPGPLTRGTIETGGKVAILHNTISTTTSESEAQKYSDPINKENALRCLVSYCVPVEDMSQSFAESSFGALIPFGFNSQMANNWVLALDTLDMDGFVEYVFSSPQSPAVTGEFSREEIAYMANDFINKCEMYESENVQYCQELLSDLAVNNERYWQNPYIERVKTVATQGAKGDKGDKGDQGDQGPQGPQGFDGKDGIDGEDGTDGIDGIDGEDGKDGDDGDDGEDGEDGKDGRNGLNGASGLRREVITILKNGANKARKRRNLANRVAQKYKILAFSNIKSNRRRSNLDPLIYTYTSVLYSKIGKEFDDIYSNMISSQSALINWSATSWNRLSKYMGATNAVYNAFNDNFDVIKYKYLDGVFREPQMANPETGLDLDSSEKAFSDINFLNRAGVVGMYYYNEEDPLFDVLGNTRKIKFQNSFDMSVDSDTSITNVTCSFTAPMNWADNVSIIVKNGKLSTMGSNAWSWYDGYIRNCIIQLGGRTFSIDDEVANTKGSYYCHVTIPDSDDEEPNISVNEKPEKAEGELLCIKVCELKNIISNESQPNESQPNESQPNESQPTVYCTYQLSSVPYISCYE